MTFTDFQPVITALQTQISVSTVVAVLAAVAGRRPLKDARDCHASDIGHWLAMTLLFLALAAAAGSGRPMAAPTFITEVQSKI